MGKTTDLNIKLDVNTVVIISNIDNLEHFCRTQCHCGVCY